jgi:hypothetical protein
MSESERDSVRWVGPCVVCHPREQSGSTRSTLYPHCTEGAYWAYQGACLTQECMYIHHEGLACRQEAQGGLGYLGGGAGP